MERKARVIGTSGAAGGRRLRAEQSWGTPGVADSVKHPSYVTETSQGGAVGGEVGGGEVGAGVVGAGVVGEGVVGAAVGGVVGGTVGGTEGGKVGGLDEGERG